MTFRYFQCKLIRFSLGFLKSVAEPTMCTQYFVPIMKFTKYTSFNSLGIDHIGQFVSMMKWSMDFVHVRGGGWFEMSCSQAVLGAFLCIKPREYVNLIQWSRFYPRTRGLKILNVFGDFTNYWALGEKAKDGYDGPKLIFINWFGIDTSQTCSSFTLEPCRHLPDTPRHPPGTFQTTQNTNSR